MKPILINRHTEKTCILFKHLCGAEAQATEALVIKIKRAGTPRYLIEYPAEIEADGRVCFYWGEVFFSLAAGRYWGDVYEGQRQIGRLAFQLHPQRFQLEVVD